MTEHFVGARIVRNNPQMLRLEGEVCPHCDNKMFPPRDVCTNCGGEAKTIFSFGGKGEVFSYTTIYEAPAGHEAEEPYTMALVKLEEGPMVTAQLTDLPSHVEIQEIDGEQREVLVPEVWIKMPVEHVTRRYGDGGDERAVIKYGYRFRPRIKTS